MSTWAHIKTQCHRIHSQDDLELSTGCTKKRRIYTEEKAEKVRALMEEKYKVKFNYYKCKFCNCIHVGRLSTKENYA